MQNKSATSVIPFFVLVFALSIPFWVLGVIQPVQLLPGLPISALGAFVPALTAFILVYKNHGFSGALQLLQRSFDYQRVQNKYWYLVIVLINPLIAMLAYGIMRFIDKPLAASTPLTLAVLPMLI